MLDAALEIVSRGGYDALQVRAVAEHARVSSRTIYENFPSLESLLIVAVAEQSQAFYHRYTRSPPRGRTPNERVSQVIEDLTGAMAANPVLTVALLRALLSGKDGIGHHVHRFRDDLRAVLASAISGGNSVAS